MVSCSWRIKVQNLNCRDCCSWFCDYSLIVEEDCAFLNARRSNIFNAAAVTWWEYLVQVIWVQLRKHSARPEVKTFATMDITSTHHVPFNKWPIILRAAFSKCKLPSKTTKSSPYSSGNNYWIYLAMANRGWSTSITGICCGFKNFVWHQIHVLPQKEILSPL